MTPGQRADQLGQAMELVLGVTADPDLALPARRSLDHLQEIVQLVYARFRRDADGPADQPAAATR